jgi:hypothetical protein
MVWFVAFFRPSLVLFFSKIPVIRVLGVGVGLNKV